MKYVAFLGLMIITNNLTREQKTKLFKYKDYTSEQFDDLYNMGGLSEEELGELFEIEVLSLLNKILPTETPIFYDVYFETDEYIEELGEKKTLQMDIIILLNIPIVMECKYLFGEKYASLENCKSKDKKYKGKLCLFRADGTRIKKSLYGLNQNKSHIEYINSILSNKGVKTTVKGITVFGGLDKIKFSVKYVETGNYVKHINEFANFVVGAQNWNEYYKSSKNTIKTIIEEEQEQIGFLMQKCVLLLKLMDIV